MAFNIEYHPTFVSEKEPHRDKTGRMIFSHAKELIFFSASDMWNRANEEMERLLDRQNAQIVVLMSHRDDLTPDLYQYLKKEPLGRYPPAPLRKDFPMVSLKSSFKTQILMLNLSISSLLF